jgi:hypothetical protein
MYFKEQYNEHVQAVCDNNEMWGYTQHSQYDALLLEYEHSLNELDAQNKRPYFNMLDRYDAYQINKRNISDNIIHYEE